MNSCVKVALGLTSCCCISVEIQKKHGATHYDDTQGPLPSGGGGSFQQYWSHSEPSDSAGRGLLGIVIGHLHKASRYHTVLITASGPRPKDLGVAHVDGLNAVNMLHFAL